MGSSSQASTVSNFLAQTMESTAILVRLRREAPDNATREQAIAHLEREGIGYNRYLPSIHLQPYMRERYGFREGMCPVSEDASSRTLALPFFTALERDAQERVVEMLAAAL